ncbi:hypothetical protein ABFX02_04G079600 [Erythranthe guttata]
MLAAAFLCIATLCCFAAAAAAQPSGELSARGLDSLLQDCAFRAFLRPRTGIVYEGKVPSNLTGIHVSALRLRSGSLRRRGIAGGYKEFRVPVGVVEQPYAERLVMVYHNLGNWSTSFYPLPGYTFLAPVLGFLAYDAADLSAANPPELDIRAAGDPISVVFSDVRPGRAGGPPRTCVFFGVDGSVVFNNVVRKNTCLITTQGHISIVEESMVPPAPAPKGGGGGGGGGRAAVVDVGGGKGGRKEWLIGGSVVGGAALMAVLAVVFVFVRRCGRRRKMRRMEDAAELGVPLPMTRVGFTKAPVALHTRTRPFLENEFVP